MTGEAILGMFTFDRATVGSIRYALCDAYDVVCTS